MNITLRPATMNDLWLLCHWDQQPHVMAASPNDDWQWQTELQRSPEWREQWIAESDGRPVGFLQIIDPGREESGYWGVIENGYRAIDIWIGEKTDLGKGYGTRIMELAMERCFSNPEVNAVLVDPLAENKRSHTFYERLGFKFVEQRVFGDDLCFVYKRER